jgi:gamma-glutamylcyclotransferase (GGCT)/AIG2-like uncharacterized protein YtfP
MNLFVYGTLMLPEIWFKVTKEDSSHDKALLGGFFRSKLNGEVYPGIYKKNGCSVDGVIYYDVSILAIKKLDLFEGERYRRIRVSVYVNVKNQSVPADTYELSTNFHHLITGEKWNLEEFIRSGNDHFKKNYFGFKII